MKAKKKGKRDKPVGKVSKRLTGAAQEALDNMMKGSPINGANTDLVGKEVKIKGVDYKGTVMSQWREGDHTIVTVKVGA